MDVIKQIDYMIACLEMAKEEINYKKRHEKIDLMATEYDNICEKYDKLYGKEQM